METNIKEVINLKSSQYNQIRVLAKGALGTVFKVETKSFLNAKTFALKEIHIKSNEERNTVVQEYLIQRDLKHRNVTQVFDAFRENDYIFILMEFCDSDVQHYVDNSDHFFKLYSSRM